MNNYFLILALAVFLYMNMWFIFSLFKKRNDIVDTAWGIGFVFVAWISFFISNKENLVGLIVCLLVTIWGIRLSYHINKRNKGKKEDYRYLEFRNSWGKWFYLRSYFQIYILQGFLLYLISLSVIFINNSKNIDLSLYFFLGLIVWIIGFLFESIGDWQLSKFINNPENKGKLMTTGLWAYTRHPNYFGEVTQWWGIWIISILSGFGLFALISPLTITFLILKISGIPMLEKKMEKHPDFASYKEKVSIFIPMIPKKNTNKGFTLIELLVVISIIALLSSVVMSSLSDARTRARNSSINSQVAQWINALNLSYNDRGGFYGSGFSITPYICLGTPSPCTPFGTSINNGFNSHMNNYISGTPNPNKDPVPDQNNSNYRAFYQAYNGQSSCDEAGDICPTASIYWFLYGNVNCPFGATKSALGPNTQCLYNFN